MNRGRIAAWAGLVGSALFVTVFTLEGFLRPGYDPRSMYISDLSLGPRGWIQIVNFVIFGTLLLIFAWGVAAEFPTGKASRGGPILLAIIASGYLLSGPFVTDPGGTPPAEATANGLIHAILGAMVFVLMPISIFVFLRRFRIDPNWQPLGLWTLVLGTICAVGVIVFTIVSKPPALQDVFGPWFGLFQRTALVPFQIWIFVFALGLLRRSDHTVE